MSSTLVMPPHSNEENSATIAFHAKQLTDQRTMTPLHKSIGGPSQGKAKAPVITLAYTIDRPESASSDRTEITSIWTIYTFQREPSKRSRALKYASAAPRPRSTPFEFIKPFRPPFERTVIPAPIPHNVYRLRPITGWFNAGCGPT
jgi:hypothetical protein